MGHSKWIFRQNEGAERVEANGGGIFCDMWPPSLARGVIGTGGLLTGNAVVEVGDV